MSSPSDTCSTATSPAATTNHTPHQSSSSLPPLPRLSLPHNFQLFTLRHGERVDQAFGADWIEQAFRLHHNHPASRPPRQRRRRQSIVTDVDGVWSVVDHPPSAEHSPATHSPADGAEEEVPPLLGGGEDGLRSGESTPPLNGVRPPALSLHHATYHRFNLNMPLGTTMHLPRRPIQHYLDDSPLTHCGHWQAATVGAAFAGHSIAAVYCSPALRSIQTAEEVVRAAGLTSRKGWKGIRVEPGLFEWMGWYSASPSFLSPQQLRDAGFSVDAEYAALSDYPPLAESQHNWYVRSAALVHALLSVLSERQQLQHQPVGNVLMVGHAGTHDTVTFSLLHGAWAPLPQELEEGGRHRLYSNYCGVARVKWDATRELSGGGSGGWLVDDDSAFDMHNTANEPFSFQLSYASIERQRRQRERAGSPTIPLVVPMESYLPPAAASHSSSVSATAAAAADTINDLNFARTFGVLLDTVHALSEHIASSPVVSTLSDTEMVTFVVPYLDAVSSSVSPLIPEFHRLAATCDGLLLHHTVRCFVCLDLLLRRRPWWAGVPLKDKNVLSWAILLHDVAKVMKKSEAGHILRDPIHPFNSAIVTARIFARQGFSHSGGGGGGWQQAVEEWAGMVQAAIVRDDSEAAAGSEYSPSIYPLRHDNAALPGVLLHLEHLFGTDTLMSDVTRLVLLHQSIPFIAAYPPASPLSDEEVLALLPGGEAGARLLRLLGWLHVVDSGSYQINRPEQQSKYVREIEDKVEQLMRLGEAEGVAVVSAVEQEGQAEAEAAAERWTGDGVAAATSGVDAVVLTEENASQYGMSPEQLAAAKAKSAVVSEEMTANT